MSRPVRAARRARPQAALLACAVSVAGLTALRLLMSALAIGELGAVLLQAAGQLLFVLLPAALGLLVLDGDQTRLVRFASLRPAQIRLFALTGALAVFPALLLSSALGGLWRMFLGAFFAVKPVHAASQGAALSVFLFLPMLLCQALIAPVCEELFFRGYLLGVWSRGGALRAALAVSLLFALAHGFGGATLVYLPLGLLFALLTLRADSVLAAMLAHACYNATLVVLEFLGLGAWLGGMSLPACAAQLLGAAAFVLAFKRAMALRPTRARARLWDGRGLSRRELALLLGAALALIVSMIVGGLLL